LCDHKKVVLELLVSGWKGSLAFGLSAESSHPGRHRRSHIPGGESSADSGTWAWFHSLGLLRRVKVSRLFVGNLPYKATENDVEAFFSEAGYQVDSVSIMRDRFSGEARGFGFVEINDENVANQAIQACNGRQLMGRALVINEARPAERRERSEGYGGGGRQRDFGGSRNRW
jgi:cold-inducible RNA-binding protein